MDVLLLGVEQLEPGRIAMEKDQRSDGVARRKPIDVLKRHVRRLATCV